MSSIKIKPVFCGKSKCKKPHFIFAYERYRDSTGTHEKYLGKAVKFSQSGGSYDKVVVLPPHTGKYAPGPKGGKKGLKELEKTEFMVPRSLRVRNLFKLLEEELED